MIRQTDSKTFSLGVLIAVLMHAALVAVLLSLASPIRIALPAPPKPPVINLTLTPPTPPKLKIEPPKEPPKPQPPKPPTPPTQTPIRTRAPTPPTTPTVEPPTSPPVTNPDPNATATPPGPTGPKAGVIGVQVSDAYRRQIFALIKANLHYPPRALREGQEGTVTVKVKIARDGTILSAEWVEKAGEVALDNEALDVFKRIVKFPPMPDNFQPDAGEFDLPLPVTFTISDQ